MRFWRHKKDKLSFLLLLIIPLLVFSVKVEFIFQIAVLTVTLVYVISKIADQTEYVLENGSLTISKHTSEQVIDMNSIKHIKRVPIAWRLGATMTYRYFLFYDGGSVRLAGAYWNEEDETVVHVLEKRFNVNVID